MSGLYDNPTRQCDVVMKGGVTSGVVYPLAVCELARVYRFRSIGGTSAGAIAAALAAAAELGRGKPNAGFERYEKIPDFLGGEGNLFGLFQPQPGTCRLFSITDALANAPKGRTDASKSTLTILAGAGAAIGAYPGPAMVAALIPAAGSVAAFVAGGTAGIIAGVASGLAAILLMTLGAVGGLAWDFLQELPKNGYGMCRGLESEGSQRVALSTFMAREINSLAGRGPDDPPVTFGDLWGPEGVEDPAKRRIDLVLMTTSLTHDRPFRVPFDEDLFYFDPEELKQYVPAALVEWMVERAGPTGANVDAGRCRKLPAAADMPIALAARMSCSFPVLLSAVPLYAADYTRKPLADGRFGLSQVWFSDGGLSSNFPIHFFDSLLPGRPTFGINLRPFHPDHPQQDDESRNVWMPSRNGGGVLERFAEPPAAGMGRVPKMLGLMIDTMQNWRDNSLVHLPGYRDRIVAVNLAPDEGGLNLGMPVERVQKLGLRGRAAGRLLVERYTTIPRPPDEVSWDNHRWVRLRSLMASLDELLRRTITSFARDLTPDRDYGVLLGRTDPKDAPTSYRIREANRTAAVALMKELDALLKRIDADFAEDSPHPRMEFRMVPRI